MSGREIGVTAGLLIIAIGAISEADNQGRSAHPAPQVVHMAAKPQPVHTVIVHQVTHEVTTHLVTRVTGGFPLAGWQIMVIIGVIAIATAGAIVGVHALRHLS